MSDERRVEESGTREAPRTLGGILRQLGPGLIIAGSIVGSGELIATTLTGAQAGFWLLWLIIIGCVIKVFTQVELGRFTISSSKTALAGLQEVPGPRIPRSGNWLAVYWLVMFLAGIGQLGGIVGGVGQALAISVPLTEEGRVYNESVELRTQLQVGEKELELVALRSDRGDLDARELLDDLRSRVETLRAEVRRLPVEVETSHDAKIWATIVTVVTAVFLVVGRYGLVQSLSTALVCLFTLITIGNLFALQSNATWGITSEELLRGFRFQLTPAVEAADKSPTFTALAAFGIIGVGAHELIAYPYWCLEKGYARYTGRQDGSAAWSERARGWMRVLQWDAWCSMFVYTFATIAFYLLGAAILGRVGLNPEGPELVRTLAVMYEPVFGASAQVLFLFGAFAVLYSTFFVANAGHARVCADALHVFGLPVTTDAGKRRWVRIFSGLFPFLCLLVYFYIEAPAKLVLASGIMQALMLPMLAGAALWYRYCRTHPDIRPGKIWDFFFWLSAIGMLATAIAIIFVKFVKSS